MNGLIISLLKITPRSLHTGRAHSSNTMLSTYWLPRPPPPPLRAESAFVLMIQKLTYVSGHAQKMTCSILVAEGL